MLTSKAPTEKLFAAAMNAAVQKATVFDTFSHFLPSLMFATKTWSKLLNWSPSMCSVQESHLYIFVVAMNTTMQKANVI